MHITTILAHIKPDTNLQRIMIKYYYYCLRYYFTINFTNAYETGVYTGYTPHKTSFIKCLSIYKFDSHTRKLTSRHDLLLFRREHFLFLMIQAFFLALLDIFSKCNPCMTFWPPKLTWIKSHERDVFLNLVD